MGQALHAAQATIALGAQWLSYDLSVHHMSIRTARALKTHGNFTVARASNHLLLILYIRLTVEALRVHLVSAASHKQIVPIVTCLLHNILVVGQSICCLDAAGLFSCLKYLFFLGILWLFSNSLHVLIVYLASLIGFQLQLMLFFKLFSFNTQLSLSLLLLVHELIGTHELVGHLLNERGNRYCLSFVFFLGANLDNLGKLWFVLLNLRFRLNGVHERITEFLLKIWSHEIRIGSRK